MPRSIVCCYLMEVVKVYFSAGKYRAKQKGIWSAFSQVLGVQLVAVEIWIWGVDDLAAADEASRVTCAGQGRVEHGDDTGVSLVQWRIANYTLD